MNFSDLGKMKEMMSQAKVMQEQMEHKLSETIVEAQAGGGMVTVSMNGRKELLSLKIEPTAMGANASDLELLEQLIDEAMKQSVQGMMGGLNLPGLT
jgi:DNA-binding YbaB/EbfC family protein